MVALQSVHVGLMFGFFIGLFTGRIMLIGVCQEPNVGKARQVLRVNSEPVQEQAGSVVVNCSPGLTPNTLPTLPTPNYAPHMKIYPEACSSSVLLGNEHHGGWYICREKIPSSSSCIVYSYGLGADWSFDKGVEALGCEVHGFDPSGLLWRQGMHGRDYSGIDYAKQYPSEKRVFHNWGIGVVSKAVYPVGSVPQEWPGLGDPQLSKSNSEPWELRSIEQTITDLGHRRSSISVLKIDVEGAEWDALAAFFEGIQPRTVKSRHDVQKYSVFTNHFF